jgi:amidohydrolase
VIEGLGGTIAVLGTPGEEGGNGKGLMANRGAFDDLDAAMMIHPSHAGDNFAIGSPALIQAYVEYFGKASHAAGSPDKGINALDAMLVGFNAFNALRQTIPYGPPISGCILKGGVGAHIIPDHTTAELLVRARNDKDLEVRLNRVHDCFNAGAVASGAKLEFRYDWDLRYKALHANRAMCELFDANMHSINPDWNPLEPVMMFGATDMGNVSAITPSIHPTISIVSKDASIGGHSAEFAAATISPQGHNAMLNSAKAMAMTVIDLIMRPDILAKVKEEFKNTPK